MPMFLQNIIVTVHTYQMTVRQSTIMQYKTTTWSIFITDVQLRQEHNLCEPDAHYAVVKVTLEVGKVNYSFQFAKSILNISC